MLFNHTLTRYTHKPRIVKAGNALAREDYVSLASHDYHIFYHAGTHYRRMDYAIDCRVDVDQGNLRFRLALDEPHLAVILETLEKNRDAEFWETDFVVLNFMDVADHVVQLGVKANGQVRLFRNHEPVGAADGARVVCEGVDLEVTVTRAETSWRADVTLPLAILGHTPESPETVAIPFDLVRFHQSNGAITAWCPIPDQMPFHENYHFPVFRFGLLTMGDVVWEDVVPQTPDVGTFVYNGPAQALAGEHIRYDIDYAVGQHGLKPGGAIRFTFHNEVIECNRGTPVFRRFPEKDWSALQWHNPFAPGYLSLSCSNPTANVRLAADRKFALTAYLDSDTPLAPGDTLTLHVGKDPAGPGQRTQLLHQEQVPLKVFVDPLGNGVFHAPETFPAIDVIGGPAQALQLHAQPTPDPGETFRLVVVATDYYGNIAHNYGGTIRFHWADHSDTESSQAQAAAVRTENLPQDYTFSERDRGIAVFDIALTDPGQYLLQAIDTERPHLHGASNPIVTDGSFGPGKIYFGDLHTHTQCSDGRLPLEQKYREVAFHRGCDFWGLTDHAYDLTTERLARIKTFLSKVNEDGRFVTLPGYEWTCSDGHGKPCARKQHGHRNVHFRDDMTAAPDGISPLSNTPHKLVEALDALGQDYVVFNHFHCGDPASYPEVDEGFEVSSWCGNWIRDTHADKKNFPHASLADLFDHDFRGAVVAGSDHGTEAYHTGLPAELTAVHADELTRDGVFDALKNGRTYATSGQKVLLRFTVNDTPPGKDHPDLRTASRTLRLRVASAMPVVAIQIVRNGKNWRNLRPDDALVQTFETVDEEIEPAKGYYYVRIRTAQGHTTWSSPVFYDTGKMSMEVAY